MAWAALTMMTAVACTPLSPGDISPSPTAKAASGAPAPTASSAEPSSLPRSQLLLFAVDFNRAPLTESLTAYGDPADPLLPVGELSRLLELAIDVNSAAGHAEGTIGQARRSLVVDLPARAASIGGERFALNPGDAGTAGADLFVRASLLERLLPLKIAVNGDDLQLTITSTEPLPIEQRAQREQRRLTIGAAPTPGQTSYEVPSPYGWLGYPAFEASAELGRDDGRNGFTRRFEGRVAADVLKTSFTGFLGTDDTGQLASATLRFERRDPDGNLPLGARYLGAGDVYTPALSLGPRSYGGMGVVLSTAGLGDGDVFERITLRGDLPLGYDVELYVNDVLRGSQSQATRGRYEFVDVPLIRGINVIRLVTYGPRGERNEQTRVINIGAGLLAPGKLTLDAGFVLQDQPVVEFSRASDVTSGLAKGEPRLVIGASLGLTDTITGTAGVAGFTDPYGATHRMLTGGLRGSLAGIALQADLADDFGKGAALALGAAGREGALSYVVRHVEYSGAFDDETNLTADVTRPMVRSSDVQLDTVVPFLLHGGLPLSLKGRRVEFQDGGVTWQAQARTTFEILDSLFALASDYDHSTYPGGSSNTWSGNLAASRRIGMLQLRASLDYELAPHPTVRAMSITADRALSDKIGLRGGAAKEFGTVKDLTVFAAGTAKLPFADAALSADYSIKHSDLRISLQISTGFAFDPFTHGYRVTRPGPASGASAALLAFVDDNGDGKPEDGEERVPGIKLMASGTPAVTDAEGHAFVTGLGNGSRNLVRVDSSEFDDVFVTSPPQNVTFSSRSGQVLPILYPFVPSSEVVISLKTAQPGGGLVALSAVRFALVADDGSQIASSTEFDGRAILENVRPGHYRLLLDEAQAKRLGMTLAEPIEFDITTQGRAIRKAGTVTFAKDKP